MDRRQQKTQDAIFAAFTALMQKKRYEHITVQDIIDTANIGRSTFYAHFETKDELLDALCRQIFAHVFSDELMREETHDFSGHATGLRDKLTHLLYHVAENRVVIGGLLAGGSRELFMRYFKQGLAALFTRYLPREGEVSFDYRLHHAVASYAELVLWWVQHGMDAPPETMIAWYYGVNRL